MTKTPRARRPRDYVNASRDAYRAALLFAAGNFATVFVHLPVSKVILDALFIISLMVSLILRAAGLVQRRRRNRTAVHLQVESVVNPCELLQIVGEVSAAITQAGYDRSDHAHLEIHCCLEHTTVTAFGKDEALKAAKIRIAKKVFELHGVELREKGFEK